MQFACRGGGGDHIEAASGGAMPGMGDQPGLCGQRELAALAGIDRRRGAAETRIASQPDFDEDERSGVEHHQVEFAEGIARVALKQSQPRFLQQGAGGVFRRRTRGLAVNAQTRTPCAARVPAPDADGRR